MIKLFIDTSSSDVSIAVIKDNQVLTSITKTIPNQHSIYTVPFISSALKEAGIQPVDVNKIMVVTGPGSFTGVRIGVTIAKVYAYLQNIEVIGVSSLKMRALSLKHDYCLSLIDANHDNYYMGLYDAKNHEVVPEKFATKEEILKTIEKYQPNIVGNEPMKIGTYSVIKPPLNIIDIVSYYDHEPISNVHFLVPNYLKLPQALEANHD